ncbi:hypothetical protein Rsub_05368 [Raphidocelis subcapitata]|uniref:Uncharacterized protein n=1 Tax=Raphidocelis subcapitata TaxID=307507 RepID=A0A2V0P5C5_9CHLO|nr:hypothetical protein Rsub_05368 [Raphidocelis subcapitata]|eukprot:GBF92285.1 hypothetical protein Rsub_05368 [Raphidocelis subcapitata]
MSAENQILPAKLRHKRSASEHDEGPSEGQQHTAPAPQPSRHSRDVRADLAEDGGEKAAKALRITTSKIGGTAQPRKPRIGADFQAIIPPLAGDAARPLAALQRARAAGGAAAAAAAQQPEEAAQLRPDQQGAGHMAQE